MISSCINIYKMLFMQKCTNLGNKSTQNYSLVHASACLKYLVHYSHTFSDILLLFAQSLSSVSETPAK
jgi:hypothetical protein